MKSYIKFNNNWKEDFQDMIETPRQALSRLRPGQRVFIGTGCGEPSELVEALTDRAPELVDVEIIQLLSKGVA
ncbi:MAG: hypothetical protein JSU90_03730, partial [Nitrospiraceae bacterium]